MMDDNKIQQPDFDNPNEGTEFETVTQVTLDDVSGKVPECGDDQPASQRELDQENVIINPDPSSMESRG